MDVMQAQLNELKANTEEIKQKIDELAAEKEEAPAPAPAAPDMGGGAPEGGMPDMGGAMPGGEAGAEEGDQTMDETGAPGDTGQDMMPPTQPAGEGAGNNMPQMTDEDLDLLFGGGENKNEEGTAEAGEEEPQDPTLKALQDAISEATDPKVIADLAKMIVEYTGGGDSEGEKEEILPGLPDETPLTEVPEEELVGILKSESFQRDDTAVGDAAPKAPAPQVSETAKASQEQSKDNGVPDSGTPVNSDSASKGGFVSSATCKSEDSEEEKEDEEDKEESEEKDEPEESESEDADEAEEAPEVEVTETVIEDAPEAGEGETIEISDLLDMSFGDIIEMVKDIAETPKDDANVFINDEGKESIPFKNCDIKKSSVDDLIRERESSMVGIDGKKYQFSKSAQDSRSINKLNASLHDYDKIKDMKAGEVLSSFRFMKSIGVTGVEENNMDALDVIVRGFDSKFGSEMTNAFMKSAGMDLDAIYKSTEIKKSEPVEGGKHIKTLAETGGTDIAKSVSAPDVPRCADAGKAYVSSQDMKAGLKSIDDLIAGRMKG